MVSDLGHLDTQHGPQGWRTCSKSALCILFGRDWSLYVVRLSRVGRGTRRNPASSLCQRAPKKSGGRTLANLARLSFSTQPALRDLASTANLVRSRVAIVYHGRGGRNVTSAGCRHPPPPRNNVSPKRGSGLSPLVLGPLPRDKLVRDQRNDLRKGTLESASQSKGFHSCPSPSPQTSTCSVWVALLH